ncbi:MAG: glutaredoxin family protein [Vicinamibacterales bacterium]
MIRLTLYSRPGCHLCEEMKAILDRVRADHPFELREVNISGDSELERRYWTEIPVLEIDGKKVAKYRIDEGMLRRAIQVRSSKYEG